MYSFIVLGIIPGTHIQIDFELWLLGTLTIALIAMLAFRHYQNRAPRLRSEPRAPFFAQQVHVRM